MLIALGNIGVGLSGIENWEFDLFCPVAKVQGVGYRGFRDKAFSDRAPQVGVLAAALAEKAFDIPEKRDRWPCVCLCFQIQKWNPMACEETLESFVRDAADGL